MFETWDFETVGAARAAEDHLLKEAHAKGFTSSDHSEFIVGIKINQLKSLFSDAVAIGEEREKK